ncbi:unnamed protein product [Choristocarpus tenellus]
MSQTPIFSFPLCVSSPCIVTFQMSKVYEEASSISREFNARGDLEKGCTIAGFLRVARAMVTHGAV